jgi:hypothetical protein
MLRNLIAVVAGVLFSFPLRIAASRLARLLIIGNIDHSQDKHAIVRLILWLTFVVDPVVAILVGAFASLIAQRSAWWLGGLAALPLFIYPNIRDLDRVEIGSSVVYVALAFAAAFVVSRCKRRPA